MENYNECYTFSATGRTARSPFPGLSPSERHRHKGELMQPSADVGRFITERLGCGNGR